MAADQPADGLDSFMQNGQFSQAQFSMDVRNPPSSSTSTFQAQREDSVEDGDGGDDQPRKKLKKDGTVKRKKVGHACLYCRRSHMTCDEGRPCQRCIKREIGHLCHDDPKAGSTHSNGKSVQHSSDSPPAMESKPIQSQAVPSYNATTMDMPMVSQPLAMPQPQAAPFISGTGMTPVPTQMNPWDLMAGNASMFGSETLGSEFNVLSDFLETLDDRSFFNNTPSIPVTPSLGQSAINSHPDSPRRVTNEAPSNAFTSSPTDLTTSSLSSDATISYAQQLAQQQQQQEQQVQQAQQAQQQQDTAEQSEEAIEAIPSATKTEKFLLTAADQAPGTRDERLARVIRAKYEAGLLKPFNYVTGYARLTRWMDKNVSSESRQSILQALSLFRPAFRAIAQGLRDIDLVFIEEAFERLLLDYDRVFSVMGVPACLWRRTGEIFKGNKEFADLVGLPHELLREGRLCIYELMAEESSVNYWEKYGQIAFDLGQKAVLTTCVLRFKPNLSGSASRPGTATGKNVANKKNGRREVEVSEEKFINCCFSFTIRRDLYGIPCMVVGNFMKC